jgi:nicotinate-nucleotide adenylyltransferase
MAQLAIGDNEKLKASDIEFRLPVPSYTIDTMTYLKEKFSHHDFCLLMGEDNLNTMHKWKNAKELLENYPVYVYPRPDSGMPSSAILSQLLSAALIHRVNAPMMDISGTFIREGIRKGKDMSYFLSPAVWKYIDEMHFYEK